MVAAALLSGGTGARAGGRVSTQAEAASPSSKHAASRARLPSRKHGCQCRQWRTWRPRLSTLRKRRSPARLLGDPRLANTGTAAILPHTAEVNAQGVAYVEGVDLCSGAAWY